MLGKYLDRVREKMPRIHNITNYVTVNDVANIILACGGNPIMSDDPHEVTEITSVCDGLNINIGTINERKAEAMVKAGLRAVELGHPVLLDPVGVGASLFRRETVKNMLKEFSFSVIRGNVSEIKAVAYDSTETTGVDADEVDAVTENNLDEAVAFAKRLSERTGSIVAITGNIDLVADKSRCFVIRNGRKEMGRITGTGCQLSGLATAFIAASPDNILEATASAVCAMGLAGEIGYSHLASYEGNATYRNRIIDAVYNMTGDELEKGANYEIR